MFYKYILYVYLYIHNKYTVHIYYVNKNFWKRLIMINHLTALIYIYLFVCVYEYIYMCVCVCVCVCIYTYIYIHTHTYIYKLIISFLSTQSNQLPFFLLTLVWETLE